MKVKSLTERKSAQFTGKTISTFDILHKKSNYACSSWSLVMVENHYTNSDHLEETTGRVFRDVVSISSGKPAKVRYFCRILFENANDALLYKLKNTGGDS